MNKITDKTKLGELMKDKKIVKVLEKHGVPCLSCPMAGFELDKISLGKICEGYNIKKEPLLSDLNKIKQ